MSAQLQLTEVDWLNIEREACKRSLATFVRQAWHVLEPGTEYVHGWHVDAICEHLEAVTHGDIKRLLINIPPGTMKSTLTSVFWPAWEWGPRGLAYKRIIGASHEASLATRDSRKMRMLVTSDWYQALWPLPLAADQSEKVNFENAMMGFRQACPVRSMTGKRGHCLTGESEIETTDGVKTVADIAESATDCYVVSYDIHSGKLVQRPVVAVARGSSAEIYRVHTAAGRVVTCSGDHRFYTARGYVEARLLSEGDRLVQLVPVGHHPDDSRDEEGGQVSERACVLQRDVPSRLGESRHGEDGSELHFLRDQDSQGAEELFGCVQAGLVQGGWTSAEGRACREAVQGVPAPHAADACKQEGVLQQCMQGVESLPRDCGGGEPGMAGRRGFPEEASRWIATGVDKDSDPNCGSRPWEVRRLRVSDAPARPSHRLESQEQQPSEPSHTVRQVPLQTSWGREVEAVSDSVALVERVCGERLTYDIQVEGTRCFFANGVLVHNCVIWDDPHSAEGSNSAAEREEAVRIFKETLPTRLVSPKDSAIIVVMQRLHEKDVSGAILSGDYGYDHLCLPMEFEADSRKVTSIGFTDPRAHDGELLFEGRFPREVVERDKKIMGSYAVAGQFQQRPAPREGGMFKRSWFDIVDAAPATARRVRRWDFAATDPKEKKSSDPDYTVGLLMSELNGQYFIEHVVRDRVSPAGVERMLKSTAEQDGKGIKVRIPQDPGAAGKSNAAHQIKLLAGWDIKAAIESGSKEVRANPLAAQAEAGNIALVRGPWNDAFLDEIEIFPNGAHDDQVDAASGGFAELVVGSTYNLGAAL